jgi:hypothetical protein
MTLGGGLDAKVSDHFAIRVGQFDYVLTKFDVDQDGSKDTQHNFRFSTGFVFRF